MGNTAVNGVSNFFTILTTPNLTVETIGNVYDDTGKPITVRHDSGTPTAP